jgi:hypothetical protein
MVSQQPLHVFYPVGGMRLKDINKHAYAGQLNSFTHPKGILVLREHIRSSCLMAPAGPR